jgi:hypothetical protein
MRIFVFILSSGLILSGCAKVKSLLPSAPNRNNTLATNETAAPIVTLAKSDSGRVASVNPTGRFAIVTFPFGGVPGTGQNLNVYRNGLKVAEAKVTGPQRNINTVADIISGEVQVNDEVRVD